MMVRLVHDMWVQRTSGGQVVRRRGDEFELEGRNLARLVKVGAVESVEAAPAAPESAPVEPVGPVRRPVQAAPKADWVAFAASLGIPAKDAESMDKQSLIARARQLS